MKTSDPRARRLAGFTLLEVMAAVLVLGLIYTVLAESAMHGLRSEGTNRRRGEASLLADRRLAELEATLPGGAPLSPGSTEEDVPPYHVTVEVAPLDLLAMLPPDPDAPEPSRNETPPASLLTTSPQGQSRIQQVTVTVAWDEAGQPFQVIRRTFTFDTTGLDEIFPSENTPDTGEGGATGLIDQLGGDIPKELQNVIDQMQ